MATDDIWILGINMTKFGKHTDKLDQDRAKGVRTLPVILGEKASRISVIGMWIEQGWFPGWWRSSQYLFPPRFKLFVEELLERRDFVAAMGLLVHWMGQAERVPLQRGDSSFHSLSLLWLRELLGVIPLRRFLDSP